jgi:hypothetical protein
VTVPGDSHRLHNDQGERPTPTGAVERTMHARVPASQRAEGRSSGSSPPAGSAIQSYSTSEYWQSGDLLVAAHDSVMAHGAYQTPLLSIMRASMYMILDAICERESSAHCLDIKVAVKVDPLPACPGPSRPAECLSNATSDNRLLNLSEVLASHHAIPTRNITRYPAGGGDSLCRPGPLAGSGARDCSPSCDSRDRTRATMTLYRK